MNKKHILVVSQYFYPEPFRINDICAEWIKRGYKVTVVTGIPNYPEGKFYRGYGWFKKRKERWNGIEIIRLPLISRGKSSIRLVLNYASFLFSGLFWKIFTRLKADLVFTFEVSPMTQALLGVWYAKRRKVPHYLYVQDLWPENVEVVAGIHNKTVLCWIGKMVDYIYRNTDMILATSPSFVKMIQERLFENQEKVKYWPQYAEEFYRPVLRKKCDEIPDDNIFKIIFTGNIGRAQGLEILPKAAKILKEEGEKICFVIVGDGRNREELEKAVEENNVKDMFLLLGRKPAEDIPYCLAACDAAFISFMDDPLFAATIPAKLQSYMACGMPIIASASGETKRIIEEAKCGICCPLGDVEALTEGIIKIMNESELSVYKYNAEQYSIQKFNKDTLFDIMDGFFNNVS